MASTKNNDAPTLLMAVFCLFFLQQITLLIEAIYALNLLQLNLDARALGILFLWSSVFLLLFRHRASRSSIFIVGFIFIIAGILSPWVGPDVRILVSGCAVGAFLIFLGLFFTFSASIKINWIVSISTAVLLLVLFKIFGSTLDISIYGASRIIGVMLGAWAFYLLWKVTRHKGVAKPSSNGRKDATGWELYAAAMGFMSGFILLYFAFASPAVFSRWTESSYSVVHAVYIPVVALTIFFLGMHPKIFNHFKKSVLLIFNIIFVTTLILLFVRHTIQFPLYPHSSPVVVLSSQNSIDIPLFLLLILSPVIILNMQIFGQKLHVDKPARLAVPLTLAGLFVTLLIFMLIFTNVWGYVEPVSRVFRNKFVLPFALAALGMIVPLVFLKVEFLSPDFIHRKTVAAFVLLASLTGVFYVFHVESMPKREANIQQLTILTFNVQQGIDYYAHKNYDGQLETIKQLNPDIICLQESDVARISGGNSDIVRYFSQKLGLYSYYGPKTVTGTFGTAILSKYPLDNCRSFFSYSDIDEIGTAMCKISINNHKIVVLNSHPAGSPAAKKAHLDALLDHAKNRDYVIAAGDYNFREDSPFYARITKHLQDSWRARPNSPQTVSIDHRIDYIFISNDFQVLDSEYVPAPMSKSDHPAHWAVLHINN